MVRASASKWYHLQIFLSKFAHWMSQRNRKKNGKKRKKMISFLFWQYRWMKKRTEWAKNGVSDDRIDRKIVRIWWDRGKKTIGTGWNVLIKWKGNSHTDTYHKSSHKQQPVYGKMYRNTESEHYFHKYTKRKWNEDGPRFEGDSLLLHSKSNRIQMW